MKFSQQLKALERQAPDEWCASFRLRHRHARNQFRTSCAKVHACTPGLPPISPVSVDCDGTRRRGKFLHYKQLKKLIKTCRNDRQRGIDPDQMEANDRRFFKQLQTEVREINACAPAAVVEHALAICTSPRSYAVRGCIKDLHPQGIIFFVEADCCPAELYGAQAVSARMT